MKPTRTLGAIAALGLLIMTGLGCSESDYATTFRSALAMPHPSVTQYPQYNIAAYSGPPKVVESTLSPQDQIRQLEEGWVRLGDSGFYGPMEDESGLIKEARRVGAELVLVSKVPGETVQGATPFTTYEPVTVYRSAIGPGGRAMTQLDTAYVPYTTYMPYTESWYIQRAIYYARRLQPPSFGALPKEITAEDRKRLGFNGGVAVLCCVRNSPAWNAGILPDDVIISMAGQTISSPEDLHNIILQNAGKSVPVQYVRGGEKRTIQVGLGPGASGE